MTDAAELPLADDVAALATHGSFCPKLCNHACPVLEATGRNDAVPWSFHRTVSDLALGRLDPADAAERLVACTGCGACAGGCVFEDQDVPAQVRAGRAAVHAVGTSLPAVTDAVQAVADGRSPYGRGATPSALPAAGATLQLLVGCRDDVATVEAAVTLLGEAGHATRVVVPDGCCGGTLRDLGADDAADAASTATRDGLATELPVVLLDPHCASEVGHDAVHLLRLLAELVEAGRLQLHDAPEVVRWHEPCLLRDTPAAGAGAAVLAAAGALVELPGEQHHGCSGAGLGLPLLDPSATAEVAAHRRGELAGPGPLVTGCSGAAGALSTDDAPVVHVAVLLADLLGTDPESVA